MAHYFDDMFQRSLDGGTPHAGDKPRLRRSSTARSIGARSDFEGPNGADDDVRSTSNSVFPDSPERTREKSVADAHMHQYISDQLTRYKDEGRAGLYENGDEFETKAT
jgi:hypothetical protein